MTWRVICRDIDLIVTAEQASALDTLEQRGFTFGEHYGTENAIELLDGMNTSFAQGCLYEWLRIRMETTG